MRFSQFQFLKERLLQDAGGEPTLTEAAHPLVLAYVGDAYYTLYVRLRLLEKEQRQVRVVHEAGMRLVSAVYQSKAYEALKDEGGTRKPPCRKAPVSRNTAKARR